MSRLFGLLLVGLAMIAADTASARHGPHVRRHVRHAVTFDRCALYGYAPGSKAYGQCRLDLRRFFTTGFCGDSRFAALHREYCHLNPPPFL
jgi:hypothetical protein